MPMPLMLVRALVAATFAVVATPGSTQSSAVLSLPEALELSGGDQPTIAAFGREAAASEEAAVAARTLPDLQVSAGVQDLPVTGRHAFDPVADNFTMYTLGVMREQVRRSKREAEASRLRAEALVSRAEASAQERRIRREVAMAWIDAVEAHAKQRLLERLIGDLRAGHRVMEAGIPTGSSNAALALQMEAEIAFGEAQLAEAKGAEARSRAQLGRWIGGAAQRPLPDVLPPLDVPVTARPANLARHPLIQVAEAQQQAAQRQVDVARADRKRDLTWSVTYGWRPQYGDLVSAQVTIPLQTNRAQRQNRRIGEASERAEAARLRADDARRELDGAYLAALADYRSAEAQLKLIDGEAIPSLEGSFQAAEARYSAGGATLDLPFAIVRRYVEANIQSIETQAKKARAAAELIYVAGEMR